MNAHGDIWRRSFALVAAAALAAGLACLFRASAVRASRLSQGRSVPLHLRGFGELSAAVSDAPLAYLCGRPEKIAPIERSRLAHSNWTRLPSVCLPLDKEDVLDWRGNLLVDCFLSRQEDRYLRACGFLRAMTNESAVLWRRDGKTFRLQMEDVRLALNLDAKLRSLGEPSVLPEDGPLENAGCSPTNQGMTDFGGGAEEGVECSQACVLATSMALMAAALLVALWCRQLGCPPRYRMVMSVLVLAYFVLMATVALRVGFTPPNGLAVYAGKAKLLFAGHGIPPGFWTQAEYAVFQPGYPPLQTLLAFCLRCLGSDVMMLILMPTVMTSLLVALLGISGSCLRPLCTLLVVAYVLAPMSIRLNAGYYAEPLAALMLVCGAVFAFKGRLFPGAAVMGLAGLVRMDGMVLAVLAALTCLFSLMTSVGGFTGYAKNLAAVCLAAFPGAVWLTFIHCLGGGMPSFSITGEFDWGQCLAVAKSAFDILALDFTETGLPLLLCLIVLSLRTGTCFVERGILLVSYLGAAIAACAVGMGFHSSRDVEWMIETWLPRYLWLSMSIPVALCLAWRADGVPSQGRSMGQPRRLS